MHTHMQLTYSCTCILARTHIRNIIQAHTDELTIICEFTPTYHEPPNSLGYPPKLLGISLLLHYIVLLKKPQIAAGINTMDYKMHITLAWFDVAYFLLINR
jgi:hypothetical protein